MAASKRKGAYSCMKAKPAVRERKKKSEPEEAYPFLKGRWILCTNDKNSGLALVEGMIYLSDGYLGDEVVLKDVHGSWAASRFVVAPVGEKKEVPKIKSWYVNVIGSDADGGELHIRMQDELQSMADDGWELGSVTSLATYRGVDRVIVTMWKYK